MAMAPSGTQIPVNLLALDGGGIRGLSELLILDEIMSRIKHDLQLPELPRPCNYFHLIGGTSTGGLVALMLGRLKMNTKEALEQYNIVAGKIFSKENKKWKAQDGTFKASTLEAQMRRVVASRSGGDEDLMMFDTSLVEGPGRVLVLAIAASNLEHPRRFRSYNARENQSINCRIWEVARATTAAPTFFKRISIAEPGQIAEDFLDAGIKCNNPVEEVMEEARLVFGDHQPVGCIISLGTGHPGTIGLSKPDAFQRVLPLGLISTLRKIATDCEEVAKRLERKFLDRPEIYFRFNVTYGAGGISLEEWKRMDEVVGHTKAYLQGPVVSKSINSVVRILCGQRGLGRSEGQESITLGQICGNLPTAMPFNQAKPKKESIFLVPFNRDLRFVGRRDVLQKINDKFLTQSRVALCGIGGIGKSQVAIEYCYIWKEQHIYGHVFWVHASSQDRLEQAYRDIARKLRLPGWEDPKVDTLNIVVHWFSEEENGPWLLVLDNADDMEMFYQPYAPLAEGSNTMRIADLLPRNPKGSTIITSRDKRVGQRLTDREEEIVIPPLPPPEAEQLLRVRITQEDQVNPADVQNLLDTLGFIPLAITQAAAFIKENSITVAAYTRDLMASDADLQDYLDEDLPDPRRDPASENSVIRTWKISFDQISKQKPRAAEMLSLIAVLDRQGIPEMLLRRENEQSIEFNKALGTLLAFSLIAMEKDGCYFEVHRLVQLSTQKWLVLQETQNEWQEKALDLMAEKFPTGRNETWQVCEILLPHALAILRYKFSSKIMLPRRASLLHYLAWYDDDQGRYDLACLRYREAFQVRKQVLGNEHPNTLASMNNLALVLDSQGKYEEAEEMHRQTLQLGEKVLGKEHPDTLTSMNNLALVLNSQGKYKEAEEMHRQILQLREKVLGKEHPDTLTSMNNLALVLSSQGKYKEAEEIYQQTLQLKKKVLSKEHPNTLASMNNLALVLDSQGKYEEAEEMHRQTLQLGEKVLGKEHPDTLTSMNNLASVLDSQGKCEEAEEMHRQTLQLREKVLGKEHPDTLTSMNNLASVLDSQGKCEEAEEMHRQTLQLREKVLGKEHPATLTSIFNLARTLERQEELSAAEALFRLELERCEIVYGPDHSQSVESRHNLASLLEKARESAEAERARNVWKRLPWSRTKK